MLKTQVWNGNPTYIHYECPECAEITVFMDEIVCSECNVILPDINNMSIDVKERFEFHTDTIKGYLG